MRNPSKFVRRFVFRYTDDTLCNGDDKYDLARDPLARCMKTRRRQIFFLYFNFSTGGRRAIFGPYGFHGFHGKMTNTFASRITNRPVYTVGILTISAPPVLKTHRMKFH